MSNKFKRLFEFVYLECVNDATRPAITISKVIADILVKIFVNKNKIEKYPKSFENLTYVKDLVLDEK